MHPYLTVLAVGCLLSAASAGFLLAQDPRRRAAQLAAALPFAAAWWSACELAWNATPDVETATGWMKLSALGWVWIGALVAHLVLRYVDDARQVDHDDPAHVEIGLWRRRMRVATCVGYGTALATLVCVWLTPWVFVEPFRVSWGWGYTPGPVLLLYYACNVSVSFVGLAGLAAHHRTRLSDAESSQIPWTWVVSLLPANCIAWTEFILPAYGIPFPRLGGVSFAVMAPVLAWTAMRYGVTFISPAFANDILGQLRDGVALLSNEGRIRHANASFGRLTGQSAESLVGTPVSDLLGRTFDETTSLYEERGELRTASEGAFPVSLSTGVSSDRRGNSLGVVVIVRDLREVESLRSRLLTQARLAAVGELAAGLAHEINNPITFVRANLSLLRDHWKRLGSDLDDREPEQRVILREGEELIEESLVGVDRTAEIVRGINRFTHAGSGRREPSDLAALLDDAASMARPHLGPELVIERDYADLAPLPCEAGELRQVFLNLIVNAAHAVGDEGRILLLLREQGAGVEVCIDDDGPGIPAAIQERIFDPFFTTKEVGQGTGLGLGIARQIVASHAGEIDVRSRAEGGTRARVWLPRAPVG